MREIKNGLKTNQTNRAATRFSVDAGEANAQNATVTCRTFEAPQTSTVIEPLSDPATLASRVVVPVVGNNLGEHRGDTHDERRSIENE